MKKHVIFMFSVVGLLLLAACGGTTEPAANPAEVVEPETQSVESVEEAEAEVVEEAAEPEIVEEAVEEEMVEEVTDDAETVEAEEAEMAEEAEEAEMAEEAEEAEMAEEAMEEEVAEVENNEAEVAEAETVAIVNPTDFDQISQTGRPQFLNSFATW